jgi:hypothetical protein
MSTEPGELRPVHSWPYGAWFPTDQWPFLPRDVVVADSKKAAHHRLSRALRELRVVEVPGTRATHMGRTDDGREVVGASCRGVPISELSDKSI